MIYLLGAFNKKNKCLSIANRNINYKVPILNSVSKPDYNNEMLLLQIIICFYSVVRIALLDSLYFKERLLKYLKKLGDIFIALIK